MVKVNNQKMYLYENRNVSNVTILPLLSLSVCNTGIQDNGFISFLKQMEQMLSKYQPKSYDFYRGGMALNFSQNSMSNYSFASLPKFLTLRGIRSISMSKLSKFTNNFSNSEITKKLGLTEK